MPDFSSDSLTDKCACSHVHVSHSGCDDACYSLLCPGCLTNVITAYRLSIVKFQSVTASPLWTTLLYITGFKFFVTVSSVCVTLLCICLRVHNR